MSQDLKGLVQAATDLANRGRWDEAERLWLEVQKTHPAHPQALFSLGIHAMQRGELDKAMGHLDRASKVAPRDLLTWIALSRVHLARGDGAAERQALESALAVDPYFLPALLAKGRWFERAGNAAAAAQIYRNVLKISPPEREWPAEQRAHLHHARATVDRYLSAYSSHLSGRFAPLQAGLEPVAAERWREAVSILAGTSVPYTQSSNQLHVPRLPAIPFFQRSDFPWLARLEATTAAIRDELLAVLKDERGALTPYIDYKPGEPVNQWQELNHSRRWSVFHLWKSGVPVPENLARCPATARALEDVPMAAIDGLCPNVMFSVLAPHTHIPPHTGETNARVIAHLPLVVPPRCAYRVGFERREWRVGETLIFDDTIEHEARNDSDEMRVVLIFDLWNPLLTASERKLVNAMTAAAREFVPPSAG